MNGQHEPDRAFNAEPDRAFNTAQGDRFNHPYNPRQFNPAGNLPGNQAAEEALGHRRWPATGAEGAVNRFEPRYLGLPDATAGAAVRDRFHGLQPYSQAWYGAHPAAWAPAGWVGGGAWQPVDWNAVVGLCGYGDIAPVSYDYGTNVTVQNGVVFINGQNVGTTAEFDGQAASLAARGAVDSASTDEWLPLGVYAMVRNEQQQPQFIVQLAINRDGILRGNWTDTAADQTLPIRGAVDKQSQRAAWIVGNDQQTLTEAGLSNLTQNEAPALVHQNGQLVPWLLVRQAQQ